MNGIPFNKSILKPEWLTRVNHWRDLFAGKLGVSGERREAIYEELAKAATMLDLTYWLQTIFSAGIATLGLVLNSPAVIIGAMLISPLMGPILSSGLAFAAGDLILGIRALFTLLVSSFAAVLFSTILVTLLPFKEMTTEILSRTQPTTLDLGVALFSGAIGSIAICKEAKGVMTSIPGVAIAVALMPPLCVIGYGIGVAISLNGTEGMRIASGGGLLFLTNIVAIIFTAMLLFLALRIDTKEVREKVLEWRCDDRESVFTRYLLMRLRVTEKLRNVGGLSSRMLMIVVTLLLLLIPLSQSLSQLRGEIIRKQLENRRIRAATELWQSYYEKTPGGEVRSFMDTLSITESNDKLTLTMRVFDSIPYTEAEKIEYTRLLAERLQRPADSIKLQLIEIPTAAALLEAKSKVAPRETTPPTVAQQRSIFLETIRAAMQGVRLPPAAQLLDYRVITATRDPLQVIITYLGERDIDADAQALIAGDIKNRFAIPNSVIKFERVASIYPALELRRNSTVLPATVTEQLTEAANVLRQYESLKLEIVPTQSADIKPEQFETITVFLTTQENIPKERIIVSPPGESGRGVTLKLVTTEKPK